MSSSLTITAKGQVTLRRSVLAHLGVAPGQKVEVALLPNGQVALRAAAPAHSITRLRGALRRPGRRAVSLEAMQEAIEHGAGV